MRGRKRSNESWDGKVKRRRRDLATPAGQLVGNLIGAQHEVHAAGFDGTDGHAGKACRARVLRKCGAARSPDRLYAEGTVGSFAREDHTHRAMAPILSERGEQNVTGMMQSTWVGGHAETATGDCQRRVCGHYVDPLRLRYNTVLRAYHRKNRSAAESFEQQPLAARIETLNEDKRCTTFGR